MLLPNSKFLIRGPVPIIGSATLTKKTMVVSFIDKYQQIHGSPFKEINSPYSDYRPKPRRQWPEACKVEQYQRSSYKIAKFGSM